MQYMWERRFVCGFSSSSSNSLRCENQFGWLEAFSLQNFYSSTHMCVFFLFLSTWFIWIHRRRAERIYSFNGIVLISMLDCLDSGGNGHCGYFIYFLFSLCRHFNRTNFSKTLLFELKSTFSLVRSSNVDEHTYHKFLFFFFGKKIHSFVI